MSSQSSSSHQSTSHKRRGDEHDYDDRSFHVSSVPGLGTANQSFSQSLPQPPGPPRTTASHQPSSSQSTNQSTNQSASQSTNQSVTQPTEPYPWKPRQVSVYRRTERLTLIGEGTYGSVFLAKSPKDELVALKKIRKEKKEGFPITAIREIKILKKIHHPNVIKLKDVVSSHNYVNHSINQSDTRTSPSVAELTNASSVVQVSAQSFREGDVFMVFEFMDHDLTGLLEASVVMSDAQIKYYLKCILEGLFYLHNNKIIHRDIKGANILIGNNGAVKIADFGLARLMKTSGVGNYTNRVVTLWYRAPELLLGMTDYNTAIDLWSLGCLFAELLCRGAVLFPGNNTELDQLNKIYHLCGTPDESTWPQVTKLKYYQQFKPQPQPRRLKSEFEQYRRSNPHLASRLTDKAIDLLDRLLTLDPTNRITAKQALDHEYFQEYPWPMKETDHPAYNQNYHEFHSKRRRANREQKVAPVNNQVNQSVNQSTNQPPKEHRQQRR